MDAGSGSENAFVVSKKPTPSNHVDHFLSSKSFPALSGGLFHFNQGFLQTIKTCSITSQAYSVEV